MIVIFCQSSRRTSTLSKSEALRIEVVKDWERAVCHHMANVGYYAIGMYVHGEPQKQLDLLYGYNLRYLPNTLLLLLQ